MEDRHFRERGSFTEVDHPMTGSLRYPGPPGKLTETPWETGPAPLLGQHNVEVLVDRLGYTRSELADLRRGGVI